MRKHNLERLTKKAFAMKEAGISLRKIREEVHQDILATGACWHTRRDYLTIVMSRISN